MYPRCPFLIALVALLALVAPSVPGEEARAAAEKVPILLDTDIGSDVDDAFALALALASPALDLQGVAARLNEAEGICRQMDGTAAAEAANPAHRSRLLHLHNLLLEQARRTVADHWAGYYQAAGKIYANDAEKLVKEADQAGDDARRLTQVTAVRGTLSSPWDLESGGGLETPAAQPPRPADAKGVSA